MRVSLAITDRQASSAERPDPRARFLRPGGVRRGTARSAAGERHPRAGLRAPAGRPLPLISWPGRWQAAGQRFPFLSQLHLQSVSEDRGV